MMRSQVLLWQLCVSALFFHPIIACADRLYVSNEGSGEVSVIDTERDQVIHTLSIGKQLKDIQLSPDRKRIFVATGDAVAVVSTDRLAIQTVHPIGPDLTRLAVEPSSALYFTGESEGVVSPRTFVPDQPERMRLGHKADGVAVRITPASATAYVTSGNDQLLLSVDLLKRQVASTLQVPGQPRGIGLLPDGSRAYVACEESGTVAVIDLKNNRILKSIALGGDSSPDSVTFDSGRGKVYVAGKTGVLFSIDVEKDESVASLKLGGPAGNIALSADGRKIYTTSMESKEVLVIDARKLKIRKRIPVGTRPWGLVVEHTPSKRISRNGGPYSARCASCHEKPSHPSIPNREVLSLRLPEALIRAMDHQMAPFAKGLSQTEREALATYVTRKPFGVDRAPLPKSAYCQKTQKKPFAPDLNRAWNGWGADEKNSRYVPPERAGLTAKNVGNLELKWAFGFRGAMSAIGQPTIVGNRVFVTSEVSRVYALDAESGCIYWELEESNARTAVSVGEISPGRYAAFFGTRNGWVVSVDAETGHRLWQKRADDHPTVTLTGSPKFYGGRLYVPVSSWEESEAAVKGYPCCSFRGNVVAFDGKTGAVVWKSFLIPEPPRFTRTSPSGTRFFGPSGVAVWNSPVVDAEKNLLYVGTGNAYSGPPTGTSDSLVAMDLATGKIQWVYQHQAGTYWNDACGPGDRSEFECPPGPPQSENEFSGSSLLLKLASGKRLLIGSARKGAVAVDPDQQGKFLWVQKRKGKLGWSPATEGGRIFVGTVDAREPPDPSATGGIAALDPDTGNTLWAVKGRGVSAALTTIEGAVLAADLNGVLRAHSTADGHALWEFATNRAFKTVNGVYARGGSINATGPVIAEGMLFVNAGYAGEGLTPGNVLLAFKRR